MERAVMVPGGVRPGALAGRLVGAALILGVTGGSAAVGLAMLADAARATGAGRGLAAVVPVVVLVALVRRFGVLAGLARSGPSGRSLLGVTAVGLLVLAAGRGGLLLGAGLPGLLPVALLGGGLFGLVAGLVAALVVVPVVLVVRLRGWGRPGGLKVALTVVAMGVAVGLLSTLVSEVRMPALEMWLVIATVAGVVGVTGTLLGDWALGDRTA